MTLDKSLKSNNMLERHRNVLSRAERIAEMKETGRWTEESSALKLPKIAHRKAAVGKKEKVEKTDETAAAGAAGAAAAPAAGEKKKEEKKKDEKKK